MNFFATVKELLIPSRKKLDANGLRDGNEVAVFIGMQSDGRGGAFPLFNLTQPVGEKPVGATVTTQTLERLGYNRPRLVLSE